MRAFNALSILSISPVLQCSACRNTPSIFQKDFHTQCLAPTQPSSHNLGTPRRSITPSASNRASSSAASHGFTYRIGASFSAKGRRFQPKEDLFSFDVDRQADPESEVYTGRPNSGQDAFFVSNIGDSGTVAFGVADGVGGWADSGIDSAHFSHGLCQSMALVAREVGQMDKATLGPRELLNRAYEGIIADREIDGGGSTACVALGRNDGNLTVANLGDSGFIQLRLNAVHHYSNPQTHAFNTPYQLSIVPPRVLALSRAFGGSPLSDLPKDASVTSHQVRHGDVLIFATDGVWDNLSPVDLLKIVSRQMNIFQAWTSGDKGTIVPEEIHQLTRNGGIPKQHEDSLQKVLAVNIVGEAKAASLNTKADGPFAKEVQKFYPQENYHGGKVDDICVIVAIVVKDD